MKDVKILTEEEIDAQLKELQQQKSAMSDRKVQSNGHILSYQRPILDLDIVEFTFRAGEYIKKSVWAHIQIRWKGLSEHVFGQAEKRCLKNKWIEKIRVTHRENEFKELFDTLSDNGKKMASWNKYINKYVLTASGREVLKNKRGV